MSSATLIMFCLYLSIVLWIGYAAYRATHNLTDFVLGGRRLSGPVTALSVGASDMSGWLLLGLPGAVYFSGLSNLWLALGLLIGAYFNWRLVAPRLRERSEQLNAITLSEYLEKRFQDNSKVLRVVSASAIIIFFTVYTAAGLKTGATLFEKSFAMDYQVALWAGGTIIIGYTLLGGFLAVSWTDFFQGILMLMALVATPCVVIYSASGWGNVVEVIQLTQPEHLEWPLDLQAISIISLMAWGLGYFGQPHLLVRFMGIRSVKALPGARRIAMVWMFLALAGAILVGLSGLAYFAGKPEAALLADKSGAESVFILLTQAIFNPWIAGLLLAAILSAVMSTVDSQLLVSSSAITEDFFKTFIRPNASAKMQVIAGRLSVVAIALIALLLASDRDGSILDLVAYAWAGLGAAFGPVILVSLYWQKMTRNGALAGILTGAATVILWKQMSGTIFDVYELFPGFIFALGAILLVSALTKPASNYNTRAC